MYRYFIKQLKSSEFLLVAKGLGYKTLFALFGAVIFTLIWLLIGYIAFSRPGYEQFAGFWPVPALKALYHLFFDIQFWASVYASMRRVVVGITFAFIIGLPFGLFIGFYPTLKVITYTPIQFLRMISPVSWMPIALLLLRTFESAIYFLITMATVWPIVLNTAHGVSQVNPEWINMAKNQGANDYQLLTKIIIPSSIPYIVTSLRLALGVAWIVLVPAEFLGISSGLGYLINDARDTMGYDRLMAVVMAIGVVGFILDGTIELVEKSFKRN
ncbi:MAG: ABC transporter permease [Desulfobacteraceae bacterium]|nr:ABC transporter permease [Desulfobacteraceae bacterium]